MIKPAPQSDPGGSRGSTHDALRAAQADFDTVIHSLPSVMDRLQDVSLDDLRPHLTELMQRLLDGTRTVVDVAEELQGSLLKEVETAQRSLSERLLDFRRAMGSGSTDTIQKSLHADLQASAMLWSRLLDGLVESLPSTDHKNA